MFSLLSSILITNTIYLFFGKLFSKTNNFNLKKISEIAINGFIYLSLLSLLINFFTPLTIEINTLVIVLIIIIFFYKKKNIIKKEIYYLVVSVFFCFLILLFDTVYRPDAGLYHLPFIKILNEEKIIFGLENLHSRFAHISIIQYISAINYNFFSNEIGILIPLISIYAFITFYFIGDIADFLFSVNKKGFNYFSVIFSSLVLIYISYKINRYSEFGNDAIGHLLYFYLISKLINYRKKDYSKFSKIYLISVFAILNKFTLIFSLMIPIYIFFKDKIVFRKVCFSLPTIFLFLWILRNIITSGCIIYPQINTCFTDLTWSNEKSIIYNSVSAEAWAKDWPNRENKTLSMSEYNKNFNWLVTWKNNHLKKIIKILFPYFIILLLIFISFKIKNRKIYSFDTDGFVFKIALFTSILGSLIFFLKFPIYRYGYSYFITSLILTLILFIKYYDIKKMLKLSIFALFIFFASFAFKQIDRYVEFHKIRNPIPEIYNIKKQHVKIDLLGGGYYNLSLNGSCMYDANLCTLFKNDKLKMTNKITYKIFNISP